MTSQSPDLFGQAQGAYARNDILSAQRLCKLILTAKPTDAGASILLGITFARQGKSAIAISYLKNALRSVPDSFEAHTALSTVLCRSGKPDEGLEHARLALTTHQQDPDAYLHLGFLLKNLGRPRDAAETFALAAERFPTDIRCIQNLAAAFQDAHQDVQAKTAWHRVLDLQPNHPLAWFMIGQLHLMLGELPEAVDASRKSLERDPLSAKSNLLLALSLSEQGYGEEAEIYLRKAIELDPNDGIALAALGFWLQEQGDFEGSRKTLEMAIKSLPSHGFAYYNLYRCKVATLRDQAQLSEMIAISKSNSLHPRDRSYLNYALGKAFEDLKEFQKSIDHFDLANAAAYQVWLAHKPWDSPAYIEESNRTQAFFDRPRIEELADRGSSAQSPILIVGMMRSGTSLMEQILSSHPEVGGGGELTFWHERSEVIFNPLSGSFDENRLRAAGKDYLERLTELTPDKRFVTDKLPHNYALLGLIHSALPKAKIVHVKRNPIDNCLSIYTTAYQRPPVFGHVRNNIVLAYQEYQRYMRHWASVLPESSILTVEYEDLIRDREAVVRRVTEFCELPWSDDCLHHEKNRRSVRTPSLWQVRQPIYTTSLERWRRFEPWISPFDDLGISVTLS